MIRLRAEVERWPLRDAFTIARGAKREAVVVVVTIEREGARGRGECVPYARYGEDPEGVLEAIGSVRAAVEAGAGREELASLLPAGAARAAIDLALWDLEAKIAGEPVWRLAGLPAPSPRITAYTIPVREPGETRALAEREKDRALLKLKLGGGEDLARVEAAREGAPDARLVVDANEGLDHATLVALAPRLAELGVELIEQPLPAASDRSLAGWRCPVALCADESFHGEAGELDALCDRYRAVNVKIDKAGGLTAALAVLERARALGLEVMVGTMVATSLAVAPAVLLAAGARWADVDGAVFLERDREHALVYEGSRVHPPLPALWG